MNQFQITEKIGRDKFSQFANQMGFTNVIFTKGNYDPTDVYFEWNGKRYTAEIKSRNVTHNRYKSIMMEYNKAKKLSELVKTQKLDGAFYVNFFEDNKVLMFDIMQFSTDNVEITTILAPATTASASSKIEKTCLLLFRSENYCTIKNL